MVRAILALGVIGCAAAPVGAAMVPQGAADLIEQGWIVDPGAATGDDFGQSLARIPEGLAIGAPGDGAAVADAGSVSIFERRAWTWTRTQELTASDATSGDEFGYACAADGEWLAVGAPWRNAEQGGVYLFRHVGGQWQEETILLHPDILNGDRFGWALAMHGVHLAVSGLRSSSPFGNNAGAVYLYAWNGVGWVFERKLFATDGVSQGYGRVLDLSDGRAAVGAPLDDEASTNAGAVYTYVDGAMGWVDDEKILGSGSDSSFGSDAKFAAQTLVVTSSQRLRFFEASDSGWTQSGFESGNQIATSERWTVALTTGSEELHTYERDGDAWIGRFEKLVDEGPDGDAWGADLATAEDWMAIGVPSSSISGLLAGAVHVFREEVDACLRRPPTHSILPAAHDGNGRFGSAVDVDGNLAAIVDGEGGLGFAGTVHLFERDGTGWRERQTLVEPDGRTESVFGADVAVTGDQVLVAAPFDSEAGVDSGAVHAFTYDGTMWTATQKLFGTGGAGGRFGLAIAADGTTLAVGVPLADVQSQTFVGAVHMFEWDGAAWNLAQVVVPPQPVPFFLFGTKVAIDGDRMVVGAPETNTSSTGDGAVFVYQRSGGSWVLQQDLARPPQETDQYYGWEVAIRGDLVLARSGRLSSARTVHVWEFDGAQWLRSRTIGPLSGNHGSALAIGTDRFWISRIWARPQQFDSGLVDQYRWDNGWAFERHVVPGRSGERAFFGQAMAASGRTLVVGQELEDAFIYEPALRLAVSPDRVLTADRTTFSFCGGLPFGAVQLVLLDIDGVARFQLLVGRTCDAWGDATFRATVPPGLEGMVTRFAALGRDADGVLDLSTPAVLRFE